MSTATLTSKGQITIRADVPRSLNVETDRFIERIACDARCSTTMTFDAGAVNSAGLSLVS